MLGADQEDVCRAVAMRKTEKFAGIAWHRSPAGNHHLVIGRVEGLEIEAGGTPLLFSRGGYGSFSPLSLAAGDADLLDHLRLVDLARPEMEALANRFDTEHFETRVDAGERR